MPRAHSPLFGRFALCVFAALVGVAVPVSAGDWSRFRGPNGSGVSLDKKAPPTVWSDSKNLKWKLELPAPGCHARSSWETRCS